MGVACCTYQSVAVRHDGAEAIRPKLVKEPVRVADAWNRVPCGVLGVGFVDEVCQGGHEGRVVAKVGGAVDGYGVSRRWGGCAGHGAECGLLSSILCKQICRFGHPVVTILA